MINLNKIRWITLGCVLVLFFVGCSAKIQPLRSGKARVGYKTQVHRELKSLPAPKAPVFVTVYKFRDQTGQYKPGGTSTGWSTAVTQGATSMLIKSLQDAGGGAWFRVLEREALPNLLNERKIIRQTRKQYEGNKNSDPLLPPLLFAPILLDGGIIAYESNLLTGGIGARYLGIGANTKYQRDTVTIYLRAVSVKNGQVLKSITTNKTIFSMALDGGVFKFVGFRDLLEVEAGLTTNEPPQMAVLEAIEKAVYALVNEGAQEGLWAFADPKVGAKSIARYLKEKNPKMVVQFDSQGQLVAAYKNGKKKRYIQENKPRRR